MYGKLKVINNNSRLEGSKALTLSDDLKPVRSSVVFSPSAFAFSIALPPPSLSVCQQIGSLGYRTCDWRGGALWGFIMHTLLLFH